MGLISIGAIGLEGGVGKRSKQGKNGHFLAISGALQGITRGAVGVRSSQGMPRVVPAAISGPVASSGPSRLCKVGIFGHPWSCSEFGVHPSHRLGTRVRIGFYCSRRDIRVPLGAFSLLNRIQGH